MNLLREPDAGNPHVRFDERDVETERVTPPRHVSTLPFPLLTPYPLPDFFIGAHAYAEQLTLITRDAARYRTCFPAVVLIVPS